MIWTNKFNLPLPITSAIKNFHDAYERVGDISVTGLVKAPRQRVLEIRHDSEIVADYSDFLWVLLGNAIHKVLETADTNNHLSEERLTFRMDGWLISGKPDLFTPEMTLDDYKCTSVFSFLLGEKVEWEQQVNLYDLLYRIHGFNAKKLRITAILRDHMKSRAKHEANYPECGLVIKEMKQWSSEKQFGYLGERIKVHQAAQYLDDDKLPECTDEERWHRPDVWAVKKKGGKKALPGGLQASEAEANDFVHEYIRANPKKLQDFEIEHRPGTDVKCEDYCPVNKWCNQFAAMKGSQ
jgi:hypothetical protein